MIRYFYGDDTYAARQAIGRLAQEQQADIRWIDREDLELRGSALFEQSSGLFGKHVPVIRDIAAMPKRLQEVIIQLARKPQATVGVVWDRQAPDKRSAVFHALKKNSQEFSPPPAAVIVTWLAEEALRRGGKVDRAAGQLLVERIGTDRWQLLSETDKLLLTNDVITRHIVENDVPEGSKGADVWVLLRALSAGNKAEAAREMESILAAGGSELYIISMLGYQLQTLFSIREGIDQTFNAAQIASQQAINPYVVQKNMSAAKRFSAHELIAAMTKIVACDFAIKQGQIDARTGLIMLITSLLQKPNPAVAGS